MVCVCKSYFATVCLSSSVSVYTCNFEIETRPLFAVRRILLSPVSSKEDATVNNERNGPALKV